MSFRRADPGEGHGQDYDNKPVQTQVHLASIWRSGSPSRRMATLAQADGDAVTSKDAATGADGTALVELPMNGSGDLRSR